MGKSTVEVAHLIQAARKLFSLVRQDGSQFVRDFIASAGRAQGRKVGRLRERKVELSQSDQKPQTGPV